MRYTSDSDLSNSRFSLRTRFAIWSGRCAGKVSRALGRGAGGVIGGRVAAQIDPHITQKISHSMQVALVTGTNGKSTTTKMLNSALRADAQVAYNDHGDNMQSGVSAALLENATASFATLEIDEMHLGMVAELVDPAVFVLLNLSRDQLDRVGSTLHVQKRIAQTVAQYPQATIVANCDDPLITAAAWNCPQVVWVAAGAKWQADADEFPLGGKIERAGADWWVDDKYRRPQPDWWLEGEFLVQRLGGEEKKYPLHLQVPGEYNRGNAAQAVAAAVVLGVKPEIAIAAAEEVKSVAGRYGRYQLGDKVLRMLLAKNPAGWQETLTTVEKADALVLAVNAQVPDGEDASWVRDIDFRVLSAQAAEMPIYIGGEAVEQLAECLRKAGITAEKVDLQMPFFTDLAAQRVEIVANYTAFRDIKADLEKAGAHLLTK